MKGFCEKSAPRWYPSRYGTTLLVKAPDRHSLDGMANYEKHGAQQAKDTMPVTLQFRPDFALSVVGCQLWWLIL